MRTRLEESQEGRRADRIIGCILGGAVGDCMGGPYERQQIPVRLDRDRHWKLSDDTQMTLATCEAVSRCGCVDASVIAENFVSWFKARRISGVGASTQKALSELSAGGHWALVGRKGEMGAGNGAAMRIAPLAFCLNPKDHNARVTIRDVCRITHHNEEAYAGALAVALSVAAAYEGAWIGDSNLVQLIIDYLPDSSVKDRLNQMVELDQDASIHEVAAQFGCSAYVVESVPFVLFVVQRIRELGFKALLEELISAGGDTDTNASIAGQIVGTLIGQEGLSQEMLDRVPDLNLIKETAVEFSKTVLKESNQIAGR